MQMKSAKELKGEETISQGNELIDCKGGPSARLPGLKAPLWKTWVRDQQDWRGIWAATAMATNSAHLPVAQLCPLTSEFRASFCLPLCISAICADLLGIHWNLTHFQNSKSWTFQETQLYLFMESNPILNILTRYRDTDYLFFLCYSLRVSKELGWRSLELTCFVDW